MTVTMPETQKSQGYSRLVVLDTATNLAAIPLTTVTAGEILTCHLYGDFVSEGGENVGEGPRKMCSRKVPQEFGNTTDTITDLQYSHLPQEDDAAPGNEARTLMTPGTTKILLEFQGMDGKGSTFVAGDSYIAHKVKLGRQRRGRTGDGEFDQFSITQSVIYADGGEPINGVVAA